MNEKKKVKREKKRYRRLIFSGIMLLFLFSTAWYLGNDLDAYSEELELLSNPQGEYEIVELKKKAFAFIPEDPIAGVIFYPGGKVQQEAYASLMGELAKEGILGILLEMPLELAVFDMDAAQGFSGEFPEVDRWYVGGHSLGGVAASNYASKHPEEFEGVILLASYSIDDLKQTGLSVLSIYGSRDGVMNRKNYEKYKKNLPDTFVESVIEGGCHAGFGNYGVQKKDLEPSIDGKLQKEICARTVKEFIAG